MNQVMLAGNIGKDPQIRSFEKGRKLATFNLAIKEEYRTRTGEAAVSTSWHMISAWGKLADTIEGKLKQGSFVKVVGRLATRSYTDKDGQKRFITEVIARAID
jgi:single-strand DNA-binding protein